MKKRNKNYRRPAIDYIELESERGFLIGSVTNVKIQPNNITVQDFSDGFANDGGFKDLSFD